jgi:hypothetical protein
MRRSRDLSLSLSGQNGNHGFRGTERVHGRLKVEGCKRGPRWDGGERGEDQDGGRVGNWDFPVFDGGVRLWRFGRDQLGRSRHSNTERVRPTRVTGPGTTATGPHGFTFSLSLWKYIRSRPLQSQPWPLYSMLHSRTILCFLLD